MQFYFCAVCLAAAAVAIVVQGQCPSEEELISEFNHVSSDYELRNTEGQVCEIKEYHGVHEDTHGHDDEEAHDHEEEEEEDHKKSSNDSCETFYSVCRTVILDLHLTEEDCLVGHNSTSADDNEVSSAQAYGYGFLMVLFVSLCSLGGVFLVPLIISNSPTGKRIYEHVYSFMVAIAISALVSDAVLHLIPHSFGLHVHEEDDSGGHGHGSSGEEDLDFLWKGCLVLVGLYGFYLLEFFLHTFGHNHSMWDGDKEGRAECDGAHRHCPADDVHYTSTIPTITDNNSTAEKSNSHEKIELSQKSDDEFFKDSAEHKYSRKHFHSLCVHPRKLKPVAWLIIIGDAVHNIADGIALGAAISQSLSLGVSTMFALVFHELPHEFGDYVILVKSGFHWGTALIINFLQSLGAILGLFIGVAISTNSESASNWILAITAGLFFYIALTDLLPDLVHGGGHGSTKNEKGHKLCNWDWIIRFVLVNFGFYIAFIILLILAIYEEDLNELI